MESKYKPIWDAIEKPETQPKRCPKVVEMDYEEFERKVWEQEKSFVDNTVNSIYAGECYLLRNAFPKQWMIDLRDRTHEYWTKTPSTFHKVHEGCADFHRIIDPELAKNYTFKSIRHSAYFFPWNNDPLKIYQPVMKRWRVCKLVTGYRADEYEKNTPKDGIVDRLQIARYPTEVGCSETHSDPWQNQKIFISAYMSKRGVDFQKGGFYVYGTDEKRIDCEEMVEVGDLSIGYATVVHEVDTIDPDVPCNWEDKNGRWWIGLYSISSDEVKERATGHAVKV